MTSRRKRKLQQRAMYTRTGGDLLTGGVVPSGVDPASLWWVSSDQLIVGQRDAKLAAVTRATSLITNTISALPWRVLSGVSMAAGVRELAVPRWMDDPQLARPDSRFLGSVVPAALRQPRAAVWSQWMRNALLRGCGFLLLELDAAGGPVAGSVRVLANDAVSAHLRADGVLVRRIGSGAEALETDFDGRVVVGGRTYLLVELSNPTGHRDEYGLARGVLQTHAAEIGLAAKAVNYADGQYEGSGAISGYLKTSVPNFTAEQADAVRKRWLEYHSGDRRSIAILNAQWDFVSEKGFSPLDMAVIESRKFSLIDIANAFGVPPYMLGGADGGSNTYSNAESRNRDFVTYSLLPWANAVEDALTALLPAGQYVEVNFAGLLRPDTATRISAYSQALKDGWLTVDEVRSAESLPPLGDREASR